MKRTVLVCLAAVLLFAAGCKGTKTLETTGDEGLDALIQTIFEEIGAKKQPKLQSADIDEQTGAASVELDYNGKAVVLLAKRFGEDWLASKLYAGEEIYWEPQYPISVVHNIDTGEPWQSESFYTKTAGLSDGNRLKINIGLNAQDKLCGIITGTFTGKSYQNEIAEIATAFDVCAAQGALQCTAIVSTADREGQAVSGRMLFADGEKKAYHLPYAEGDMDVDVSKNVLASELLYLLTTVPRR